MLALRLGFDLQKAVTCRDCSTAGARLCSHFDLMTLMSALLLCLEAVVTSTSNLGQIACSCSCTHRIPRGLCQTKKASWTSSRQQARFLAFAASCSGSRVTIASQHLPPVSGRRKDTEGITQLASLRCAYSGSAARRVGCLSVNGPGMAISRP